MQEAGNGLLPPGIILLGLQILLLLDLLATYLFPVSDVEEAGNGLLPPGIILHGLMIVLLLKILATSKLSLKWKRLVIAFYIVLPPRIILHDLQILLLLDFLATYHTRAIEEAEASNGLLSSGIILLGLYFLLYLDLLTI